MAGGLFEGKTVIVTGAGAGIGRGLAVGFARDGGAVFGIARTQSALEETARACPGAGMRYVAGDVSEPGDVERLFGQALESTGKVDILVNNAAVYPKAGFLESTHDEWTRAMAINVNGVALCCRHALAGMLERGHGRIVNVGSFAWKGAIPRSSAYSASKAAVSALTRCIANEIDRARYPDLLINELLPGIFATGMSDQGDDPASAYPYARHLASLPAGGPCGQIFVRDALYVEHPGLRARLGARLARLLRRGS